MDLLLLSNSTMPGQAYLQWPLDHIAGFLQGRRRVAFAPFALPESAHAEYTARVREVLAGLGVETAAFTGGADDERTLNEAEAVVVGGGNTFLLLRTLYRTGLVRAIARRVRDGMPYVGWSAGANVACPTIMTTNDMPIVEPPSFKAMHLVGFQINPHYTEATIPGHGGESRDQRIAEFLALNPAMPVVGLREGSLLRVHSGRATLVGAAMKLFRAGREPVEVEAGREFRADLGGL